MLKTFPLAEPLGTLGTQPSPEEGAALQRAVLQLFARWQVRDDEAAVLLGDLSTRTLVRWRKGELGRVPRDLSDRMANLLGIHKGLRLVFADPQRGYDWVRKPNEAFGGQSALQVMLGGGLTDILRVRRYLDSLRGGW